MTDPLLAQFTSRLRAAFGPRFHSAVVYGSRARGDAAPDSDLDLLVVLADPVRFGEDLQTAIDAIYPLQLQVDFPIHVFPVGAREYASAGAGFLAAARREGATL